MSARQPFARASSAVVLPLYGTTIGEMKEIHRNVAIPRLPVLGWASFRDGRRAPLPGVGDGGHVLYTTSGRAAIALALRVLGFAPGQRVLVPTYHCPTMIAPVARLQGEPVFFPITAEGAPDLARLAEADLRDVRVMLVAHYFGLPQRMSAVRAFCDARGIALIEDCAHAFFGVSEGRAIGSWGDLAIASLTKFFPVPEGGCLVSRTHAVDALELAPRSLVAQVKSIADAAELGARYRRFPGANALLRAVFGLKEVARGRPWRPALREESEPTAGPAADELSDALLGSRPTQFVRWVAGSAHRARIVELRRRNYRLLAELLSDLPGAAPFSPDLPAEAVPYVFPLRVDHPMERYRALRMAKVPLFRWDQIWPGTPELAGDLGSAWAVEMFQLACHQDLTEDEIRDIAATVHRVFAKVA
jgi:dTDP-4-amino-4,6-dideoxygalactose transaminase